MDNELSRNIVNSWSVSQEKLLKKWFKQANSLSWKHTATAKRYFFIDRVIGIPTVIANTITGTSVFLKDRKSVV